LIPATSPAAGIRIDKLLWYLRLAAARALAQRWAEAGHMRLNGRRIERASATVRAGDILVLPLGGGVRVIEIMTIPSRRGPAPEAQSYYRTIEWSAGNPTASDARHNPPARPAPPGDQQ